MTFHSLMAGSPSIPSVEPDPKERLRMFDFLLEQSPDQIYFKDRQSRFLCLSRALAERLGVAEPSEMIGKTDFDMFAEDVAQGFFADEQRIMETGEPMIGKVEHEPHADGRSSWAYSTKLPFRNSANEVVGICGINKDYTRQKEMEEALREERNLLREVTAELELRNHQLESDLLLAREVQLALLPRAYPQFGSGGTPGALAFAHYYKSADALGGDFFDIFPLSPTRAAVLICDVMGHGMRAALITAIIRTLLGELRPMMADPGKVLTALNLRLCSILGRVEETIFATAFFLVADTEKREINFANAGHPTPVRLAPGNEQAQLLVCDCGRPSPALGLFDGASYPCTTTTFAANDRVVLFTDGLFENESPDGERFGRARLLSSLQEHQNLHSPELFTALVTDVAQFSQKPEFDDDVCLVVIEHAAS